MVSMLGMVLGVTSLIVVLSIMNGFAGELRGRILSLVPHGYIEQDGKGIEAWQELLLKMQSSPAVVAVSPYISDKVILGSGHTLRGGVLTAVDPELESKVSGIADAMVAGTLDTLDMPGFNVILGATMARIMGVAVGDQVEVTVPRLTVTPLASSA